MVGVPAAEARREAGEEAGLLRQVLPRLPLCAGTTSFLSSGLLRQVLRPPSSLRWSYFLFVLCMCLFICIMIGALLLPVGVYLCP